MIPGHQLPCSAAHFAAGTPGGSGGWTPAVLSSRRVDNHFSPPGDPSRS